MNNDKGGHAKLRGDIQRTDCLASSRVERDNSIMGFGKQEGVDNWTLGRSNGPRELPVSDGGLRNISGRGNGTESVESEMLGEVQVLLVFVIHLVPGNSVWVDEREGSNRECLLERKFIRGFCNLVSIERQHVVCSVYLCMFRFYSQTRSTVMYRI